MILRLSAPNPAVRAALEALGSPVRERHSII